MFVTSVYNSILSTESNYLPLDYVKSNYWHYLATNDASCVASAISFSMGLMANVLANGGCWEVRVCCLSPATIGCRM